MVLARFRKLTGSTTTTRDNKLRVLRLLMKYALATDVINESPTDVLKVVKLWSKPTRREQVIPSANLKDWAAAVGKLKNRKAKVYLLLLLYTGLRAREALLLRWADIDFTNDCLTFKDTKNHSDFTTYIPSVLKVYLRDLQALTGNNFFCFPGSDSITPMAIPRWQSGGLPKRPE
jgi:integrase